MNLVLPFVFMVASAVLSARIADGRGRRPALWATLGVIFGVLAVATVALLPRKTVQLEQPVAA